MKNIFITNKPSLNDLEKLRTSLNKTNRKAILTIIVFSFLTLFNLGGLIMIFNPIGFIVCLIFLIKHYYDYYHDRKIYLEDLKEIDGMIYLKKRQLDEMYKHGYMIF